MYVTEIKLNKRFEIEISRLSINDFKLISKREFFFNWKHEKNYEVYKQKIIGQSEILGLVSLETIPDEWRIHIRLLSVSSLNKGKNKVYSRVVGNFLTFIGKIAIKEFAELACVSLKPKGAIAQHYIDNYGMNITGASLSLELVEIMDLIEKFDNGKN